MADEEYTVDDMGEGYEEEVGAEDMGDENNTELEEMKRKLAEMQADKDQLLALQAGVQTTPAVAAAIPLSAGMAAAAAANAAAAAAGGAPSAADIAAREEADGRSVYIGNVEYAVTPEELQQHFMSCGTVNRVTILTDRLNNPKGYAYLEFVETDSVQNAVLLDNSELAGRQIRVTPKRTNMPGLRGGRGGGRGRGGRGRGAPPMPYGYAPNPYEMYGYAGGRGFPFPSPNYRGRGGYAPPGYGGPPPGYGGFYGVAPPPYFAGGFPAAPRGRGRGRHAYSPY